MNNAAARIVQVEHPAAFLMIKLRRDALIRRRRPPVAADVLQVAGRRLLVMADMGAVPQFTWSLDGTVVPPQQVLDLLTSTEQGGVQP
ncbi:hypothetical protein [Pseudomonas aeruginosa]|uniref:hypothetical protein n=1 Tax=Pseudomonas aeruginosa TaxID=287 RepID=UPI000F543A1D|nr:hypothetical protein [Pseudomonas aeruginosa]RQF66274.1 hypothetical protein IPC251_29165 [Pseudomonas aeruginosa]